MVYISLILSIIFYIIVFSDRISLILSNNNINFLLLTVRIHAFISAHPFLFRFIYYITFVIISFYFLKAPMAFCAGDDIVTMTCPSKKDHVDNFIPSQEMKKDQDFIIRHTLSAGFSKEIDIDPASFTMAEESHELNNVKVINELSKVYHTWIKSDNTYSQTNNALTNIGNEQFYQKYCKSLCDTKFSFFDLSTHIINNPDLLKLEGFRCSPYLNQITSASVSRLNQDSGAIIIDESVINRDLVLWNDYALTHLFNKPNSSSLVVQEFGHSYKDPVHRTQLMNKVSEIRGMRHNIRRFDLRTQATWEKWLNDAPKTKKWYSFL